MLYLPLLEFDDLDLELGYVIVLFRERLAAEKAHDEDSGQRATCHS